jgi:hypothetical protein
MRRTEIETHNTNVTDRNRDTQYKCKNKNVISNLVCRIRFRDNLSIRYSKYSEGKPEY